MTHPCDRINAGEHPLKAWREYLGWDLQKIRQETGIRVDKLDKIERGVVRLTKTEAMKIGRAMDIAAINLLPHAGSSCADLDVDEDAILAAYEEG